MFLGHFGAGLGLKKAAPHVSLGTLFLAAQFVDLLWPTLLLLGAERVEIVPDAKGPPLDFVHYPISHSLLMAIAWGVLFAGVYFLLRRSRIGAIVCGLAVLSHWLLDLLVHLPDLPIFPWGGPQVGFGLWESRPVSLAVEMLVFAIGTWLYARTTRAADRVGSIGFWSLLVVLVGIQLANTFGPPPPSVAAVAWVGQAQWLFVAWGYWVDRHRAVRANHGPPG